MAAFTLDTSGAVPMGRGENMGLEGISLRWSDLDAFTQGYIEALLRDFHRATGETPITEMGFADLAPEALALILKDCARFKADGYGWVDDDSEDGQMLWSTRQNGEWADLGFPPLTVTLAGDGKVYLKENS